MLQVLTLVYIVIIGLILYIPLGYISILILFLLLLLIIAHWIDIDYSFELGGLFANLEEAYVTGAFCA